MEKNNQNPSENNEVTLEQKEDYKRRLMIPWEHCENVRQSAKKLATRLIDDAKNEDDLDLARRLIKRASCHDLSKFSGVEFKYLTGETDIDNVKLAVSEHQCNNDHHPQHFNGGIKDMNSEQIAEMVCDWFARSGEQGTNLRDFIKETAMKNFGFTPQSNVYKRIKRFVDLLLEPQFKPLNK